MRSAFLALICGFAGAWLFHVVQPEIINSASAGGDKIVRASQFDLVDGKGRLRAQFGFAKEGPPGLWLMDEKGVARLAMGLYPDGTSHFGLQDKDGNMIQLMRSIGAGESPLLIFKNKGQDRMILGLNSSVEASFIHMDKKGKKTIVQGFADGP